MKSIFRIRNERLFASEESDGKKQRIKEEDEDKENSHSGGTVVTLQHKAKAATRIQVLISIVAANKDSSRPGGVAFTGVIVRAMQWRRRFRRGALLTGQRCCLRDKITKKASSSAKWRHYND